MKTADTPPDPYRELREAAEALLNSGIRFELHMPDDKKPWADYLDASGPATILALLAERDRLEARLNGAAAAARSADRMAQASEDGASKLYTNMTKQCDLLLARAEHAEVALRKSKELAGKLAREMRDRAVAVAEQYAREREEDAPFEETADYSERMLVYAKHVRRVAVLIAALTEEPTDG